MFHRTVKRGAIGTISAAAALSLALTAPPSATASPTASHRSPSAAVATAKALVHTAADTTAERKHVRTYWSAARMQRAVDGAVLAPRPTRATATAARVATGTPTTFGAKKPKPRAFGTPYLGGPWTGAGQVVPSTGKVFFTLGGTDYVCSGNVVTSANRDLVTTAGHCVNEGPGAFATNFAFVPAYRNGSAPYGTFVARQLTTTSQWGNSGDFNYDVAMAVLNPVGGQHVADVVGTQGIAFNQPRGQFLYSFGYPAASPYNGQVLDYCSDNTTNDTLGGSNDERLDCNMTGGSSGGPWFAGFSEASGTGTQVSVNSFGYQGERNAMYGPYFGSVIQSLYNGSQTL